MLAEHPTWKRKYLFCLGTQNVLKFRPSAPLHPTSLILTAFPVHPLGDRWLQSPAAGEPTPVVFPRIYSSSSRPDDVDDNLSTVQPLVACNSPLTKSGASDSV